MGKESHRPGKLSRFLVAASVVASTPLITSFNTDVFEKVHFNNEACDPDRWDYINKPYRLKPVRGEESCVVSVVGTVVRFDLSPDGDLVIDFLPDKEFRRLTQVGHDGKKPTNDEELGGTLRAEVICHKKPPQGEIDFDAWEKCVGYYREFDKVPVPKLRKGLRISVTGTLITDVGSSFLANKGWNEIHPVERIVVVPDERNIDGEGANAPNLGPIEFKEEDFESEIFYDKGGNSFLDEQNKKYLHAYREIQRVHTLYRRRV